MSGFLRELESIDRSLLKDRIGRATEAEARRLLSAKASGGNLPPGSVAALVSPAAAGLLDEMAGLAKRITAQRFGRTIQIYAPLYLSNHCVNSCVYCGFNSGNLVPRRTLSLEEVEREAGALKGRGIHQVLLVTGECPDEVPVGLLAECARRLKPMFPSVAVEIYPMSEEDYRILFNAGVDGLTIYQETYDKETYLQAHPAGPKRDFDHRLGAPERGGAAGFRQIGIGALLGLDDWRMEACLLARHAAYLTKHHWRSQVSISFPRLRPAAGGFQPPRPVSDRDLAQMIGALRLVLPDAGLVLSTRESPQFRDNMSGIGITRISAGSKTSPGGYLDEQGDAAGEQFSVHDSRTVDEVAAAVRSRGYDPVWKDWDAGFETDTPNRQGAA